jgi:hypothetical protein
MQKVAYVAHKRPERRQEAHNPSIAMYEEIATGLKLDQARFNEDRKALASLQAIQKEIDQARLLGVRGTSTIVKDQQLLAGPSPSRNWRIGSTNYPSHSQGSDTSLNCNNCRKAVNNSPDPD